ncbi:hypothetical protein K9M06_00050 [Candidatus Bipolaricaulota bacterium]|nr:hypothetical protein [Candidatus Bipolaricaulota bacterium]
MFGGKDNSGSLSSWTRAFRTIGGILVFAIIVSGITIYFARQEKPIIYRFNPEKAYIYTDHPEFYSLNYSAKPGKSVTLFSNGFHPTCITGCRREMTSEEARNAIIQRGNRSAESSGKESPGFAYLKPGGEISLDFDMKKGERVKDRFPYANRFIVEINKGTGEEALSLIAGGYEYEDGSRVPEDTRSVKLEFEYDRPFGDYSVFSLPKPAFVSSLELVVDENRDNSLGLREGSFYLERSGFRSLINSLKSEITEKIARKELKEPGEIIERLTGTDQFDPYSPMTEYLIARVSLNAGAYEAGLGKISVAAKKLKVFGDFLETELKSKDIYEVKARLQKGLGQWESAIENMKKTTPEIDRSFLSEVYLKKFEDSEREGDIRASYYNGIIAAKETPRILLGVLGKYRKNRDWLEYGLDYLETELKEEGGSYLLPTDETAKPYLVIIARSLLNTWLGRDDRLSESVSALERVQESTDSKEISALINAVQSKLYRKLGEYDKAENKREKAVAFFDNYASLYDEWQNFLN